MKYTQQQLVSRALRQAVLSQIRTVKTEFFTKEAAVRVCPIAGTPLTWKTCHVDHAPPRTFKKLVETFLLQEGLAIEDILVGYNGSRFIMSDVRLATKWRWFHKANADLRVVSIKANLSDIRKSDSGDEIDVVEIG